MDVAKHNFGTNTSEKETALLLDAFGLDCVALNWKMIGHNGEPEGEIDGIFYDEQNQLYIIYDDSIQEAGRQEKISKFLNKWKDPRNQIELRDELKLKDYPIYVLYIDKSEKLKKVTSINYTLDDFTKIIYTNDYVYFDEIFKKIGKWAKNDFYNFLGIRPRKTTKEKINAIQIYIGNTPAYVFADRVENILTYSYISRRRDSSAGYQRMVEVSRVKKMAALIKAGTINSFPNSILLNCIDKIGFAPRPKTECPCHVAIDIPTNFSSCRVVDGQHRLLAFSKLESRIQDSHSLPIVMFDDMPIEQEIQTFIDINDNQKGIDPNLIYSLKADMTFQAGTKENIEKVAVQIATDLNEKGPLFKGNVFLGNAGEKKKAKVTLTTIVQSLIEFKAVDNGGGFLQTTEKDTTSPAQKLSEVSSLFAQKDGANVPFYRSNNGAKIIIQFTSLYYRNFSKGYIKIDLDKAVTEMVKIIVKNKPNLSKKYGKGGFLNLSKLLLGDLKSTSVDFLNFETELAALK